MKEAIVSAGPSVKIVDSPIPKPGPDQIVTKVVFSGSNPKDWKISEMMPNMPNAVSNQGDDISGIVHEVGENVSEFKKGDRVAAFHEMMTSGGSYAEYAVSWKHTTFFLPKKNSFEEGAALPLAAMTSAVGLYARLHLPAPWLPAQDSEKTPLVIYGASSAVGYYALQLARKSNVHPLICVAGRASAHVEQQLDRSKGDTIVDYRNGDEAVVNGIKDALNGAKLYHVFDAVSEKGSVENNAQVLQSDGGKITFVLPGREYPGFADSVDKTTTTVGDVHGPLKDFGYVYFRYLSKGLEDGWFRPQPQEIVPGGLEGVEKGLANLKDGTASAVKYVFKIEDTPGVGK
ncbi:hypothetical protein MBLNU230_g4852t1 [Neophaeotheca triangularis]